MAGMSVVGMADVLDAFDDVLDFADEMRDIVFIIGTNVEYAAYVEFGTSRMQAQPYLFPAARRVARSPGQYGIGGERTAVAFMKNIALAIEREAKQDAPVDTGRLQNSIEAERVA